MATFGEMFAKVNFHLIKINQMASATLYSVCRNRFMNLYNLGSLIF